MKRWWADRKNCNLRVLQVESLRWAVEQELALGFVGEHQRAEILGPLYARLRGLGEPAPAAYTTTRLAGVPKPSSASPDLLPVLGGHLALDEVLNRLGIVGQIAIIGDGNYRHSEVVSPRYPGYCMELNWSVDPNGYHLAGWSVGPINWWPAGMP